MTRGATAQSFWSRLGQAIKTRPSASPADLPTAPPHPVSPGPVESPRVLPSSHRVAGLEKSLGIEFNDPEILREALTHRSYLNEAEVASHSNERLEFMGDAVLGLISTDYLFHRFGDLEEGELTNLRSALVRTETLARFAQEINLGQYLFLGRGEEMSKGRQRAGGLACAFEALIAAIYEDQGYEAAQAFVMRFLESELEEVVVGRKHRNAKSMLQELVQARLQQTPTYHLVDESGPDHAKSFTVEVRVGNRVLGRGHDRSKRGAEQIAAEKALARLSATDSQRQAASG
jgi:ribonuclease III